MRYFQAAKPARAILPALLGLCMALPAPVRAQAVPGADSEKPLEITADETLEWHRDSRQYIARGNAAAKQGDTEIHAATLTADYNETDKSSFDIYRLTAEGGVTVLSRGHTVNGDKATYDVPAGKAVITGDNLRLTAPDETVTARDRFEYTAADGRLSAHGDVLVVRGEDKIRADTVSAFFTKDATGQNQLKKLTATGHVVITTPTETLSGDAGSYDATSDMAELHGKVKIARGPNVLEGARAEINLTTHVSRMIGGGGPVRGVFYPGSEKKAPTPAPVPVTDVSVPLPPQPQKMMKAPAPVTPPAPVSQKPQAAPSSPANSAPETTMPSDEALRGLSPGAVQGPVP